MSHRFVQAVLWIVATIASITVVFAGVSNVRTAVAAPGSFQLPAAAWPAPEDPILTATTVAESTTTTSTVGSSSIEEPTTTSTLADSPPSSEEQQAVATPTTEPTETEQVEEEHSQPDLESYAVDGGWVSIGVDGNGVHLESASPRPGWTVKVENAGPGEVVVVFKDGEDEIHFVAKLEDGRLKIKIED